MEAPSDGLTVAQRKAAPDGARFRYLASHPAQLRQALDDLFRFSAGRPVTRALLQEWKASMGGLAPSTASFRLSAARKLAEESRRNGLLSAEAASNLTDVPNVRQQGTRLGNWLTREQARELLIVPDRSSMKGKHDYGILALLSAASSAARSSPRLTSRPSRCASSCLAMPPSRPPNAIWGPNRRSPTRQ